MLLVEVDKNLHFSIKCLPFEKLLRTLEMGRMRTMDPKPLQKREHGNFYCVLSSSVVQSCHTPQVGKSAARSSRDTVAGGVPEV